MKTIAIVGNPNSGKTTLFNGLTGSNQHIGNWPGVTVEKKEGILKYKNQSYKIVDLPGTYSLGAYSEDEIVARDFVLKGNPDLIINVVDASNIERNLYLTSQLLEMGANVIIALNMMDEAEKRNIKINLEELEANLGLKVVPTVASKERGLDGLKESLVLGLNGEGRTLSYQEDLGEKIKDLEDRIKVLDLDYPSHWTAIKILEGDEEILKILGENPKGREILGALNKDEDLELEIVDQRYSFINKALDGVVSRPDEEKETISDKLDKILTHKILGLPIFAGIMFLVFQLTFTIGEDIFGESVAGFIDFLADLTNDFLIGINSPSWLISLVSEGIFAGLGAVVEFIPLIMILYFFMGILEDTGYMARAAYVMDGIMRSLGLHGKTFISMIIGFGCNVPGVMSTRTLDNKKDKMIAILINPFMSCGAKIPIYLVFTAAFFPNKGGLVLFGLYSLGIIVALTMGKIFSKTLFKEESSDFIMELPPYRLPIFKYVIRDMWDKVWGFLKRAGTVIFTVVTLLWVLSVLPAGVEPHSQDSFLGQIGSFIAPIFKPAGYGNWQAAVSLFAGIPAKEAVVATLGMVYAGVSEGTEVVSAIQAAFTPLSALSFMVMVLLYTPCAAVIGTVKKETNSYKWALFVAVYPFIIAWIASVLVYQIGSLLGF